MLSLSAIQKSFPGVRALGGVDLDVRGGEVHALVGENGAGKSTMIKIIAGAYQPNAGTIRLAGEVVRWSGPEAAKRAGIHVIYQEFVLFPNLSVAENIMVGNEIRGRFGLIDHKATAAAAARILDRLGVRLDVAAPAGSLSIADQQMVEIAKALVHEVRVLILDEPSAVLSTKEVDLLFGVVRQLRAQGVAVIYVSHRLDEIFALCDRVTILKDGLKVATRAIADTDHDGLVRLMVGRDLAQYFPPKAANPPADGPAALAFRGVSVPGRVRDATLAVRPGEIVGLAGLIGAGRTELALAAFGILPMTGTIEVKGQALRRADAQHLIRAGVGFVTEDRKGQGLFMNLDVARNVTGASLSSYLRGGFVSDKAEQIAAREEIAHFAVACRGPAGAVDSLSGGNQQKILFGRWTRACRTALILDEPTRGVDVGAKSEIYRIMRTLADSGVGILMISSELQEVVGMSDRVVVMREGAISGELTGERITEEDIMKLAAQSGRKAA
ncbi:MAG: sugar ABC transporter ATP-binding protein [Pseudomonadota bacterium]